MKVITKSKELSPKEVYDLTMNPTTQRMVDAVSQEIEVEAWLLYEDIDTSSGEVKEVLSILTPEGEVFGTISPTFKDEFTKMHELMNDMGVQVKRIEIASGTSKAGRTYITCVYKG